MQGKLVSGLRCDSGSRVLRRFVGVFTVVADTEILLEYCILHVNRSRVFIVIACYEKRENQ